MAFAEESLRLMRESGEVNWCPLEGSKIVDFYKNKTVFVTGATGFLGKLLVEKLLRACPDISCVYILVRPKKDEDEQTRIDKLYKDKVFGPLSKIFPKFQDKIKIIKGDVGLPDLGMSTSDLGLLTERTNVIFHIAATVRLDEKIKTATAINARGTRDLLNIAKQCKNLESFVHVSTAYGNCNRKEIDEIFYEPPITSDEFIEMVESTPESLLEKKIAKLIKKWPNTYTFTKVMAEDAVVRYGQNLPICIVRPAIVIATYKEPLRGWIDNFYGVTGVTIGAGVGLIKSLPCDSEKVAELVPGDYVINNMIAASYKTAIEKKTENIPIYNYASSVNNRQTWAKYMQMSEQWGTQLPSAKCVWYCALTLNKYYLVHATYAIFFHFVPAIFMDLGLMVSGKQPMMWKVYKKIFKFESAIAHFASEQWKFHNKNTMDLWNFLTDADRQLFPFNMNDLDWLEYHKTQILGLRTYVLDEDISTLPQARIRWRRFYIAHQIVKSLIYIGFVYLGFSFIFKLMNFLLNFYKK